MVIHSVNDGYGSRLVIELVEDGRYCLGIECTTGPIEKHTITLSPKQFVEVLYQGSKQTGQDLREKGPAKTDDATQAASVAAMAAIQVETIKAATGITINPAGTKTLREAAEAYLLNEFKLE